MVSFINQPSNVLSSVLPMNNVQSYEIKNNGIVNFGGKRSKSNRRTKRRSSKLSRRTKRGSRKSNRLKRTCF